MKKYMHYIIPVDNVNGDPYWEATVFCNNPQDGDRLYRVAKAICISFSEATNWVTVITNQLYAEEFI